MVFEQQHQTFEVFAERYLAETRVAQASIDLDQLRAVVEIVLDAARHRRRIFACGNGGSSAVANHLMADWLKGVHPSQKSHTGAQVTSLCNSVELITALANDVSYEEVFSRQLATLADEHDVLVAFSSSGRSKNIVRVVSLAKQMGLTVVAFTGFDGGEVAPLAKVNLKVASENYGIIEDTHQLLMHLVAQQIARELGVVPMSGFSDRR